MYSVTRCIKENLKGIMSNTKRYASLGFTRDTRKMLVVTWKIYFELCECLELLFLKNFLDGIPIKLVKTTAFRLEATSYIT